MKWHFPKWVWDAQFLMAFDMHFAWRPGVTGRQSGQVFRTIAPSLRFVLRGTASLLTAWDVQKGRLPDFMHQPYVPNWPWVDTSTHA